MALSPRSSRATGRSARQRKAEREVSEHPNGRLITLTGPEAAGGGWAGRDPFRTSRAAQGGLLAGPASGSFDLTLPTDLDAPQIAVIVMAIETIGKRPASPTLNGW